MKKKRLICVVFLCSFLNIIGPFPAAVSAQQGQHGKDTQRASAPGPRFLPFMDESHPIHAVLQSATTSGYSILLANAVPCEGANWCLYGTVRGSTQPFSREGKAGKAVPVLLQGGIKASFFDSECDTYCNQAYVEWQENGYYYSIGIKGPNPMRKTLIKVANSAAEAPSKGGWPR